MATKTQLIGGAFQDSEGNILSNGILTMELNQDESVSGVGNICSGIIIKFTLDIDGNVSTSPAQFIWANDVMLPANSFYKVIAYKSNGQRAWGPNSQQVTSGGVGGGTFDVGTWIPNQVISWTPFPMSPVLKVNGINNVVQSILNLVQGTNVTIVDNGNGSVTISATGSGGGPIIYDQNGNGLTNVVLDNHIVTGTTFLTSGSVTINLVGNAIYGGVDIYSVTATYIDVPPVGAQLYVTYVTNSQFIINSTDGTDNSRVQFHVIPIPNTPS